MVASQTPLSTQLLNNLAVMDVLKFKNITKSKIEIIVEPAAEYIDWNPGKTIELESTNSKISDCITFEIGDKEFFIFEELHSNLKIKLEGQEVYSSSY